MAYKNSLPQVSEVATSPEVGVIAFTVPNLDDCTTDPQALDTLSVILGLLSAYSYTRATAMRARLHGDIEKALQCEKRCERYYQDLPEWARW